VLRVLPRVNDDVNEEWISDKTRFMVDGLTSRRLDKPYVRKDGKLVAASWDEAFAAIAKMKPGKKRRGVAGDLRRLRNDVRGELAGALGGTMLEGRQTGWTTTPRASPRSISTPPSRVSKTADAILIVGSESPPEAPLVNTACARRQSAGRRCSPSGRSGI
jgi:NADH-quinone oxidoreductase subunit G